MTSFQKVTLMIAGSLWLLVLLGFHFVVPVFAAMFADFGAALPRPTQLLIDCAAFFRAYPIAAALMAIAVILVGAEIERRKSITGMRLYFTFSVFALVTVVVVAFLPVFQLGAVAAGIPK
jgi:type II secretory pathway component PulF